jgi:hypothetical protein
MREGDADEAAGLGSSASDEPRKRRRAGADLRLAGESTRLPARGSALWSSVLGASQTRTGRNTRGVGSPRA